MTTPLRPVAEWALADGQPDLDDALFEAYETRLNGALTAFWKCPGLPASVAVTMASLGWVIDTERAEEALGYRVFDRETREPLVAITVRACREFSDDELMYLLAKLIAGWVLYPTLDVEPPESLPAVQQRMRRRAMLGQVGDLLRMWGLHAPSSALGLDGPMGHDVIGMGVLGLSRREVFRCVNGEMSRSVLARLRAERSSDYLPDDADWITPIFDGRAVSFWAERRGPWQDAWGDAHDALCAEIARSASRS